MENQLNPRGQFSQDSLHCRFFTKSKATWKEAHIDPQKFSDRIIFMSMFNDINVDTRGNDTSYTLTSVKIQEYATRFM